MARNRPLTEAEILAIIDTWSDSEDDFQTDDQDNADVEMLIQTERMANDSDFEDNSDENPLDIENMPIDFVDELPNPEPVLQRVYKELSRHIVWLCQEFPIPDKNVEFLGDFNLTPEQRSLKTPYSCFKYLFDEKLMEHIVSESNLYSCQKNINNPKTITKLELQKYIGICQLMSVVNIPDYRRYWHPIAGNKLVQDTMSVNSFEKIKSVLHFNNNEHMPANTDEGRDRLFKIRPLIDALTINFQKIPPEQCLSVDEQLCSTKAKSYLKQYIPSKPHKWGYKLYVLSGISGYTYNFEIYTGQENSATNRLVSEPDLGASGNTVVRLLRPVPKLENYRVYFDNFYSSVPLAVELSKMGFLCLGTIRRNRIPNCKLPSDTQSKKMPRGSSTEFVCTVDDVTLTTVSWKDKKQVNLISNFVGRAPMQSSTRYSKKDGNITIECFPNY